jgi:hypothetical protein
VKKYSYIRSNYSHFLLEARLSNIDIAYLIQNNDRSPISQVRTDIISHSWYDDPTRPSIWRMSNEASLALPWPGKTQISTRSSHQFLTPTQTRQSNIFRPPHAGSAGNMLHQFELSSAGPHGELYSSPFDPRKNLEYTTVYDSGKLETNIHISERTDYGLYFHVNGAPITPLVTDRFNYAILPHSRAVFLNPIPHTSDLSAICSNIRGGALERIDFHNFQGRTCVGVFFITAEDAMKYIRFCRRHGGIYWGGTRVVSTVQTIPRGKGGHEIVKINVAKGIKEGATRCLIITGLPEFVTADHLTKLVKTQSRNVKVEIESVEFFYRERHKCVVLRMGTIGTALGARLVLSGTSPLKNCGFDFVKDPCEGNLQELEVKWNRERYEDLMQIPEA